MWHYTLATPVTQSGIGLHTGCLSRVVLQPAPFGTGRVFVRQGVRVPATASQVVGAGGATVLGAQGATVHTPEHLLAALAGLGITDARMVLTGPEVPALDGSALPWVRALRTAGVVRGPTLVPLGVPNTLRVEAHGGVAVVQPSTTARLTVGVDYPQGLRGKASYCPHTGDFATEVAWARTFVFADQIERLRALGRGAGASKANTVVWGKHPLRAPDEPVRHKLLDALGDLALLGHPWRAWVHVERGSHALHHALVRRWLAMRTE